MNMDELVAKSYAAFVRSISFDSYGQFLWGEGTGFFVRYKNSTYLITAKHNVVKDGVNLAQHIFIAMSNAITPVPFDRCSFFEIDGGCEESQDVAIFHVDSLRARSLGMDVSSPFDLEDIATSPPDIVSGVPLRIIGYPTQDDRYDWDKKVIHNHMLIKDGVYFPSILGNGFGEFKGAPSDFEYSGISGSPVLGFAGGEVFLVGVVIRGSSSSGIIHYVKIDGIVKAVACEHESFKRDSAGNIFFRQF